MTTGKRATLTCRHEQSPDQYVDIQVENHVILRSIIFSTKIHEDFHNVPMICDLQVMDVQLGLLQLDVNLLRLRIRFRVLDSVLYSVLLAVSRGFFDTVLLVCCPDPESIRGFPEILETLWPKEKDCLLLRVVEI